MKKRNTILVILLVIVLTFVTLVNIFSESGPLKTISNIVVACGAVYGLVNKYLGRQRFVKNFNRRMRKHSLGELLIEADTESVVLTGAPFNKFKSNLLRLTKQEVDKRLKLVKGSEIFAFDFTQPDSLDFMPGGNPVNYSDDWRSHLQEQYVFITGEPGSGKTFELLRRAGYLCEQLDPGLTTEAFLENRKIPLYIELKSLDQALDTDWMTDYVLRTAAIANIPLKQEQVEELINSHQVVYFFDGIDEISESYIKDTVNGIGILSAGTGITASCREDVFIRLRHDNDLTEENLPAKVLVKKLDEDRIRSIINSLERSDEEKREMLALILENPALLELLSRSIFLNVYILVYNRLTPEEKAQLALRNSDASMDVLWRNYEDIIFRKKLSPESDILGIRTISVWLANLMGQESFYVESIQPRWLSKIHEAPGKEPEIVPHVVLQRFYFVITRVLASMIIGIAMGCIIATPFALMSCSVIGGMTVSLLSAAYNNIVRKFSLRGFLPTAVFSVVNMAVLISVCGLYQGFVLPRAPDEMLNAYFAPAECWSGVILGIALSTIFTYRIIMEQKKTQYILPIEIFHFDWPHAIRYGLTWGVASGLITGAIAVYVKQSFQHHIFIRQWLIPYLNRLIVDFDGAPLTSENENYAVFAYAFLLTFVVSSIIIILLAGRYNDKEETNDENKQQLNYGIISSRKHAGKHALKVAALVALLYYFAMMRLEFALWFFCLKITIGVTLLAFLWFGGMEVINHWILRVNLAVRGIAPRDYEPWVQAQKNMGLISPSGYKMKFYHGTLTAYYHRYPLKNNPRLRLKKNTWTDIWTYRLILLCCILLLALPFYRRYLLQDFWRGPWDIVWKSSGFKEQNHAYLAPKGGTYYLKTGWFTNVGTFVGYVLPKGTTEGFMGMPIDSAYNLEGFGKYRHAALLFRTQQPGKDWTPYRYATEVKMLYMNRDERIEFLINDKEWHNNLGRYQVALIPCDTCARPARKTTHYDGKFQ